jgi:hypothetical protein
LVTKKIFVSQGVRKTLPDANDSKLEMGEKTFYMGSRKTESSFIISISLLQHD